MLFRHPDNETLDLLEHTPTTRPATAITKTRTAATSTIAGVYTTVSVENTAEKWDTTPRNLLK
jgi:hypothetical protein